MDAPDKHAIFSTLRENIVEHLFAGELLRRLWQRGILDAEILKSEFDAGGYDLVLTCRDVTRHIQLKVSRKGGARVEVNVSLRLAEKASGCVVWIVVDDDLNMVELRWFGDRGTGPLPDLAAFKVVRHSKGDAKGVKHRRIGHRVVPRREFTSLAGVDDLLLCLLGQAILR